MVPRSRPSSSLLLGPDTVGYTLKRGFLCEDIAPGSRFMMKTLLSLSCLSAALLFSKGISTAREDWDQDKALAKVQQVLELEETGQPWNEIKWLTDPKHAVEEAQEQGKPILVFFYLKTEVGPPEAPC